MDPLSQELKTMERIEDITELAAAVTAAVADATITDIHTHLFPPSHGDLLLWGVDELLTGLAAQFAGT